MTIQPIDKNPQILIRKNKSLLRKINSAIAKTVSPQSNVLLLVTDLNEGLQSSNAKERKTTLITALAKYAKLVQEYTKHPMSDLELILAYYAFLGDHNAPYIMPKIDTVREIIVLGFSLVINKIMFPTQAHIVVYPDENVMNLIKDSAIIAPIFEAIKLPVVAQVAQEDDPANIEKVYLESVVLTLEEFYLNATLEDNLIASITDNFTTPVNLYLIDAYVMLVNPTTLKIARRYAMRDEKPDPFINRVKLFVNSLTSTTNPNESKSDVIIDSIKGTYKFTKKGIDAVNREFGQQAFDPSTRLGGRLHAGMSAKFFMKRSDDATLPTEYKIEDKKLVKLNLYLPNIKEAIEALEDIPITLPTYVINETTLLNTLAYSKINVAIELQDVDNVMQLLGLRQLKPYRYESLIKNDSKIERIDFEQSLGLAMMHLNMYISNLRNAILNEESVTNKMLFSNINFENDESSIISDKDTITSITIIMDDIRNFLQDYLAEIEGMRSAILSGQLFRDDYFELIDNLEDALTRAQIKAIKRIDKNKTLTYKESEVSS